MANSVYSDVHQTVLRHAAQFRNRPFRPQALVALAGLPVERSPQVIADLVAFGFIEPITKRRKVGRGYGNEAAKGAHGVEYPLGYFQWVEDLTPDYRLTENGKAAVRRLAKVSPSADPLASNLGLLDLESDDSMSGIKLTSNDSSIQESSKREEFALFWLSMLLWLLSASFGIWMWTWNSPAGTWTDIGHWTGELWRIIGWAVVIIVFAISGFHLFTVFSGTYINRSEPVWSLSRRKTLRKLCSSCGGDVSEAKRIKDNLGDYYCEPCWAKVNAPKNDPSPVSPSEASTSSRNWARATLAVTAVLIAAIAACFLVPRLLAHHPSPDGTVATASPSGKDFNVDSKLADLEEKRQELNRRLQDDIPELKQKLASQGQEVKTDLAHASGADHQRLEAELVEIAKAQLAAERYESDLRSLLSQVDSEARQLDRMRELAKVQGTTDGQLRDELDKMAQQVGATLSVPLDQRVGTGPDDDVLVSERVNSIKGIAANPRDQKDASK